MSDSEWTVATLKEHILALLAEKDRAIGAALSSAKEAVGKAEAAAERRFEGLNELRGAMSDQQATLISRETVDALFKSLTDKFDALTARVDRTEGRGAGVHAVWVYLIGGASVGAAIVALFLHR